MVERSTFVDELNKEYKAWKHGKIKDIQLKGKRIYERTKSKTQKSLMSFKLFWNRGQEKIAGCMDMV